MIAEVQAIADRLVALRLSLATAESCTGGMLGAVLTAVPGSSDWFRGGMIVYSNDLKIRLAGVDPVILESEGAVSPAVARELASGARTGCGADLGVGITGIAGPGGGSADKPVGMVCLALATEAGVRDWTVRLSGGRDEVRSAAVRFALDCIRQQIDGGPGDWA